MDANRFAALRNTTGLVFEDGLQPFEYVESDLIAQAQFEGTVATPRVTIAIPTYNRTTLLTESVKSALAQRFDGPVEILIVDNQPGSTRCETLIAELPELSSVDFRYYVNRENIGWVGNFNRCITLARGHFVTILNDDDLLAPDFLATLIPVMEDSAIDALHCKKRDFLSGSSAGRADLIAPPKSRLRTLAAGALTRWIFLGRDVRRVPWQNFQWGWIMESVVGLVFVRERAIAIGGFYPDDAPSDSIFMTRVAAAFGLWQHRFVGVHVRIEDGQSRRNNMLLDLLVRDHLLRSALVRHLPGSRARLLSLVTERYRVALSAILETKLSRPEVEARIGGPLPKDRPQLIRLIRIATRGF